MFDPELFRDRRVLVSGGGSGIGRAAAEAFLRCGARVLIASRNEERLTQAAATLSEIGPCSWASVDIRDSERIEALADSVDRELGGLDILINNAGGQFPSPAEEISDKGWRAVIDNNLNGTWYMTRILATRFFLNGNGGSIVNVIANVFRGFPGMAHTGAARAGVENLTRSLAVEWAPKGVRINALAPGIIRSTGLEQYPPELLRGISKNIPMKRLGEVNDVAMACLFLAGPAAAYVTGETLYVDGGQRLWGDVWDVPDPPPTAPTDEADPGSPSSS